MADAKISELTAIDSVVGTDLLPIVDDSASATKKATATQLKTFINTPGGSDTHVQFNDGGAFAGDAGLTFNKTSKALTLTGATITTSSPVLDLAQTWNASGTTFTGLRFNAAGSSDANSASASLLMDLQVGGSSRLSVTKGGSVSIAGTLGAVGQVSSVNFFITSNAGALYWSDLLLTRRGAANLRLGAADAASPVAQTLSVQSVVAGTTNTAGQDLKITGSQGTGTGAGGSIIFQVAPAGTTGTAQNALATALTINSANQITVGANGTVSFPTSSTTSPSAPGIGAWVGTLGLFGSGGVLAATVSSTDINLGANVLLSWSLDTILRRDTADTLAQRRGTNAQESRIYGSFTATDNFQRMSIKTLRESSGALSGASYTTTIAIPAYAVPVGVTTRVTTAITGATSYDVGDGTDVDLWGNDIAITLGSQSRTADFTAIAAVDAAATSRTVTLTAVGSNFTGGVVEICVHYLTTEAD